MALTGRFEFRRSLWTGKIVLQVEEKIEKRWLRPTKAGGQKRWRDATGMDLTQPELHALMDMRHRAFG